jgi:hypothetical protein
MSAGRCIDERPTKCIAAEIIKTSGNLDVQVRETRRESQPAMQILKKCAVEDVILYRQD